MKVKTGIFWVIDGKVICDMQIKEIGERISTRGFVDYSAQHAWKWNMLGAKQYPYDDFAT